MTKVQIVKWAGMENETIDFAIPLEWAKKVNTLEIDAPLNFVWHYPQGSNAGRPLSLGDLFVKAVASGNLVPLETLEHALEMQASGEYSRETILAAVKMACAGL